MRTLLALTAGLVCFLSRLMAAEAPTTANRAKTLPPEKARAKTSAPLLLPRAPVAGQPFDDREIELYLAREAHQLWTAGRIQALRFQHQTCTLALAQPSVEKLSGPEIAARAEAATLVLGEFSREPKKRAPLFTVAGGAFVIAEPGICVTSLHVAREKTSRGFCAMTRDGRVFPVRAVLAFDPVNDLAILQLDLPSEVVLPVLPLARERAPIGTPVFVMSHPDDRFFLLSTGHVARHTLWRTDAGAEAFMTITADFAKGSSGCPVLNENGAVVGIVNNTESIY